MTGSKVTVEQLQARKREGRKIAALTAYDYPMTRLLDEAGVPLLLVGDSLGMVVLGHPDTTRVTMADMRHHVAACARARPRALLAADLPYRSYDTPGDACRHAQQLIEAGAEAVKAEGGAEILAQVKAMTDANVPFLGHLGMLPQRVVEEGGYRKKGRSAGEAERLLHDAMALEAAGAFAIVLELVVAEVAARITREVSVPTLGIGSGADCDGQILVTHDLVGAFPWFTPRFVAPKARLGDAFKRAVETWKREVEG